MTNPVTPYLLPLLASLIVVALVLVAAHRWDIRVDHPEFKRPATRRAGAGSGPSRTWITIPLFTVGLVGAFVWSGDVVTEASGGGHGTAQLPAGVSVTAGKQIFWGVGKCSTCHSVGTRGGKIRGPNLGASSNWGAPGAGASPTPPAETTTLRAGGPEAEPPPIGIRAAQTAAARAAQLGHPMTGTEYLVESIADPSAYIAHGYKDEMPKPYLPPISLTGDQITSVILYLQSLGGTPDPSAIHLPPEIRQAAGSGAPAQVWKAYLPGDSSRGHDIFFDLRRPAACATCHRVGDRGGRVGPDLTSVAENRTPHFIVASLLEPGKDVTSGPDTAPGHLPEDFARQITMRDFHDLLAFLETLQRDRPADPQHGRELFFDVQGRVACAKCHRVGNRGGDVGPELTEVVRIRTYEWLQEAILEPGKRVAMGYETVQIRTDNGGTFEGVVVRETADSLWLGTSEGKHVSIPAGRIVERRKVDQSTMPEIFAKPGSAKDLRDLLAFLETLR